MKIIIIEDEKPSARRLNRLVSAFGLKVLVMLHSVEEALVWFQNHHHPDLIFLDIQLSDGLSFEIFEHIEVKSAIIFTTAYDEYALKAFKLNSIDYLLKPIDQDELKIAIQKFEDHQYNATKVGLDINEIKNLLIPQTTQSYKKRFTVSIGQHLKIIDIQNIECLYSENKATYLHTIENRNYLIDYSLDHYQQMLNPQVFFKVNRAFIVHIKAIKDIVSYTSSRLKITLYSFDKQEIIVSRDRVKDFKNWIS